MREGSAHEAIAGMSDVAVASLVQRLWESRNYEATLGFSGPNPHVEAVGATPEGTTRTVRTRVVAGGTTARDLRVFAARCDRDGVEPHVVALRSSIGYDIAPIGVAVFDAAGLAVELREAGVDVGTDDASVPETDWFGDGGRG